MHSPVKLSKEQKILIISLPLRVGLEVSMADDEGDNMGADEKEIISIKKALARSGKLHRKSLLVGYVSREVKKFKISNIAVGDLYEDAKKVINILNDFYTPCDVQSYKAMIVEVATSVARAYKEEGYAWEEDDDDFGKFEAFAEKVSGLFSSIINSERYQDMNISPAEDTVITDIVLAMK